MAAPILIEDIHSFPHKYEELVEVVLVSDDDGHDYLIPKENEEEFETLDRQCHDITGDYDSEESDLACSKLSDKFDQYRKECSQPPLYARVGYQKDL